MLLLTSGQLFGQTFVPTSSSQTAAAAAAAAVNVSRQLRVIASSMSRVLASNGTSVGGGSAQGDGESDCALSVGGLSSAVGTGGVAVAAHGLDARSTLVAVAVGGVPIETDAEGLAATLASAVVGLALLDKPSGGAPPVLLSEPPAGSVIWVTLPVGYHVDNATASGENRSACVPTPLFGARPAAEQTCVAGCCLGGLCGCQRGYTGARCELQLRCALVRAGESTFDDGSACETIHGGSTGHLLCGCKELGAVAALRFRLTPPTNSVNEGVWEHMGALLGLEPQRWLLPLLLAVLPSLLALAYWADLRTLYMSAASPRLPWWLRPLSTDSSSWEELQQTATLMLLTRSSLLRLYHVFPGFTVYTTVQLVVVLANSVMINALCVALFLQRDSEICSALAAGIVTLSITCGSLLASVGRLLFRWGNLPQGSGARARYYENKRTRQAATLALRADACGNSAQLEQLSGGGGGSESLEHTLGSKVAADGGHGGATALVHHFESSSAEGGASHEGAVLVEARITPPSRLSQLSHRLSRLLSVSVRSAHSAVPSAACKSSGRASSPSSPRLWASAVGWGGGRASKEEAGGGVVAEKPKAPPSAKSTPQDAIWKPAVRPPAVASSRRELLVDFDGKDLALDPNGGPALGVLLRPSSGGGQPRSGFGGPDAASAAVSFVPAVHCGVHAAHGEWRRGLRALAVTVDEAALKDVLGGRQLTRQLVVRPSPPATLAAYTCTGWRAYVAWGVNLALLLAASTWLVLVLLSLHLLPSRLEAQSVSSEGFGAAFRAAVSLSLVSSFLIVDGVKISVLTLMSMPMVEALMRDERYAKLLLRKPMRRLHKVLDVCM